MQFSTLAEVLGHYVSRGADISKLSRMIDEFETADRAWADVAADLGVTVELIR